MAGSVWAAGSASAIPAERLRVRHSALVRITHWLTAIAFIALAITGGEIVISHPRFYWGEAGNVLTPPLFALPIPASRSTVPTGYGYVMPDQNGWSRYLHFEAAWLLVIAALLYGIYGVVSGHFRRNLLPRRADLSAKSFAGVIAGHLRLGRREQADASSYNVLQRFSYLGVIFVLFPLVIWTGLAMSPAVAGAFPGLVSVLGGQQSARTIHFFVSLLLGGFLIVHLAMIAISGFGGRMRAMITGRDGAAVED